MPKYSTTQHRACYLGETHDSALAEVVVQCGFQLLQLSPREEWGGKAAPDLLLIDAGCAGSEREAATLLTAFDLHGGQVLLLGTSQEQPAWERWLRSGEAIFLRQPVSPSYLEALLKDIGGEIPAQHHDTPQPVGLDQFGLLLGSSQPMRDLYLLLRKAAGSDASLCVHGESGTGKELVARSIHAFSERGDEPFCAINCGAIPSELVESELFGHERGSFSGAERRHQGVFERAEGGTLLLDEITEMPESTQVKLLRVLESGQFRRVGGEEDLRCGARLISATNRDPTQAIADGLLREDLFYRICQFEIPVPPLRDRGEDILALARRFMTEYAQQSGRSVRLGEDAESVLRQYHWPGNVRELRHVIHNACRLCRNVITPDHLPQLRAQKLVNEDSGLGIVPGMKLEVAERRLILATLDAEDGDRDRCARTLGISVRTLYNRLRVYRSSGSLSLENQSDA